MMLTLSPLGDSGGEARAEGELWRKFTLQHSKSKFIQSFNQMQWFPKTYFNKCDAEVPNVPSKKNYLKQSFYQNWTLQECNVV